MKAKAAQLSAEAAELLPLHVAVIMDGNGRWAKQRKLPRAEGHRRGAESARAVIRVASELGVKYLTLYTFSMENWNRPKTEVEAIMRYLMMYLKKEAPDLNKHNVRLEVIGQTHRLPDRVQAQLEKTRAALAKNTGLTLVLALSYGSRAEIVDAARSIAQKAVKGTVAPDEIDEELLGSHLYTGHMPDPDLLVRTSGEMRLSNFLLWQMSYAEMVVTPVLWPDFRKPEFIAAIEEFARRHRRFGKL
ncbi:MAG TPA: isoprenyl transferase [Verrucomicrobiales bacterium]|nr:isoprenyl transferase [Verrucomicrobiales bacterium]